MRPTILLGDQTTLLHSAVHTQDSGQDQGRARILQFLLSSGETLTNSMPLDHQNCQGWTALKLATRKHLERCVEVLLDHDANPDLPDCEQFTALHNAVGSPDILKLLATKSRNIDAPNHDGETPLYLAAERGLVESALMLLEYGANPNTPNKKGEYYSFVWRFITVCLGIVPLFLAARGGHLELVRGLLKNNAAANFQGAQQHIGGCGLQQLCICMSFSFNSLAPLHWAAYKERQDIALLLIEHGADILLKDTEERTPLSLAGPDLAAKMTS